MVTSRQGRDKCRRRCRESEERFIEQKELDGAEYLAVLGMTQFSGRWEKQA